MISSMEHLDPETLNALVDGELSPNEHQLVQDHLAACHGCALRVVDATQLKSATARAGHRFAPSADAIARLTTQLRSAPQPSTAELAVPALAKPTAVKPPAKVHASLRSTPWLALAAALLVAVSVFGWRQARQTDTLAAELLDQHLAVLSSGATPQVISTDRHTVKPWFQGRIPFSFNIPEPGTLPPDTALRGADLAFVQGQPAALLLFTIHKHQVSVFVTQRTARFTPDLFPRARAGFQIRSVTAQGLHLVALSDVNAAELDALVAALVRAQAPA